MENIFFNSSLPRSGSTILQNILGQNPEMYVTQASGMLDIMLSARERYTTLKQFRKYEYEYAKKPFHKFCKEGLWAYYNSMTDKKYVMEKSRGWGINYDFVTDILGEEPKMICLIRDLRDIFTSMELHFRENPDMQTNIYDWMKNQGTSVPKRIDLWIQNTDIGVCIERLSEMLRRGFSSKVLFVKYEDFCLYPQTEIVRIYSYLGIPAHNHDFEHIARNISEDDEIFEIIPKKKWITEKLEPKRSRSKEILSRDVCDWIYNNYKWFFENFRYNK
jgi:sulfotransferase